MLVEDTTIERAAYGIYRPWFEDHVYKNLTISRTDTEPFNRGLDDESLQHGSITVDGLTFANFRPSGMPLIQISAFNPSGKAETHIRNLKVGDRGERNHRALVNMGGGPRTKQSGFPGVPVIVHDHFGPGRHARFVADRSAEYLAEPERYHEQIPETGDESRVAEVGTAVAFPMLLDPVDDQPPATVITWPVPGLPAKLEPDGSLMVRGTTTDDVRTGRVTVNGVSANDVDYNFHRWEVRLASVQAGKQKLTAVAEDEAGNSEQTPHAIEVEVVR
jgi:hypothetical protein